MDLGLDPTTRIATPGGAVALADVEVGTEVWAVDPDGGTPVARAVRVVHEGEATGRVAVVTEGATLRACTPGLSVWDAFEEIPRAAGSLAATSEVVVWSGEGTSTAQVDDVPETPAAAGPLRHLTLEGTEGGFFADGVLVRHLEAE